MITLSHVFKRYPGGRQALNDVGFSIDAGELVFITGHSGAGKTTLLKLLVAIERPTSGSIIVNGQNVGTLQARAVPFLRRKFGLIFQDHKLLYDRTVFHNVALPLDIAGYGAKEAARRVRAALDKVGLLKYEKAMPITLSGGEPLMQRRNLQQFLELDTDQITTLKLTPNRSDCLSVWGVARELAAISASPLSPIIYEVNPIKQSEKKNVLVEEKSACPRYCGRVKIGRAHV